MAKRLYVGNLAYSTTNIDLETLFAPFGTVRDATVVMDNATGRSKGFGFVEMQNDSEAQAAIAGLDTHSHEGRPLTVNEARPREERRGERRGAGARY